MVVCHLVNGYNVVVPLAIQLLRIITSQYLQFMLGFSPPRTINVATFLLFHIITIHGFLIIYYLQLLTFTTKGQHHFLLLTHNLQHFSVSGKRYNGHDFPSLGVQYVYKPCLLICDGLVPVECPMLRKPSTAVRTDKRLLTRVHSIVSYNGALLSESTMAEAPPPSSELVGISSSCLTAVWAALCRSGTGDNAISHLLDAFNDYVAREREREKERRFLRVDKVLDGVVSSHIMVPNNLVANNLIIHHLLINMLHRLRKTIKYVLKGLDVILYSLMVSSTATTSLPSDTMVTIATSPYQQHT
ncbi:hypothetical protein MAR_029148 [Mya arenaria]|uniref:Uncharacterized protein n=1 Tax=Mya arenaria TaxID=6604 RepID=A0ABY7DHQ2_MYAAR|nr:hypothetical protein MAR_029148 [Mya arenaria]